MTAEDQTEQFYKWLRACGYPHEQALKELEKHYRKRQPVKRPEQQTDLFTRTKERKT